jgi:uncharacterized protein YjbJ (UPF0337 family)
MGDQLDQTKGKIKQAVGGLTGDKDLENEGRADERVGKVKEFFDDWKDKVEALVDKVRNKLSRN